MKIKYVQEGHTFHYQLELMPVVYIRSLADVSLLADGTWETVPLEQSAEACRLATIAHLKMALAELEAEDVPNA